MTIFYLTHIEITGIFVVGYVEICRNIKQEESIK